METSRGYSFRRLVSSAGLTIEGPGWGSHKLLSCPQDEIIAQGLLSSTTGVREGLPEKEACWQDLKLSGTCGQGNSG